MRFVTPARLAVIVPLAILAIAVGCNDMIGGILGEQAVVIAPEDGENIQQGSTYTIYWIGIGDDYVYIEYNLFDGNDWVAIEDDDDGNDGYTPPFNNYGNIVWRVPDQSVGAAQIRVRPAYNYDDNEAYSGTFSIGQAGGTEFTRLDWSTHQLFIAKKSGVAWGDYNNDTFLDIGICGADQYGYQTELWRNQGSDTFGDYVTYSGVSNRGSFAWCDLDGDGDIDFTVGGSTPAGSEFIIYRNRGSAYSYMFETVSAVVTPLENSAFAWGDYDSDGDQDLVVCGYDSTYGPVTRFYKNNHGTLYDSSFGSSVVAVEYGDVVWCDFNNDSRLDLAICGIQGTATITRAYINDGSDLVEEYDHSFLGAGYGSLAWGDYNGNGVPDLAVMGAQNSSPQYSPKLEIHEYDSEYGRFAHLETITGACKGNVAWGDYNNDGMLDLVFCGTGDYDGTGYVMMEFYRNTGGSLSFDRSATGLYKGDLAWADYERDGDLDLIASGDDGSGTEQTYIYRNDASLGYNNRPYTPLRTWYKLDRDGLWFEWESGGDDRTGDDSLTFNVSVYNSAASEYVVPPMSQQNIDGWRNVAAHGNAGHTRSKYIATPPWSDLACRVQAVDTGFYGSPWSARSITVGSSLPHGPAMVYPPPAEPAPSDFPDPNNGFFEGQTLIARWVPFCLGPTVDVCLQEPPSGPLVVVHPNADNTGVATITLPYYGVGILTRVVIMASGNTSKRIDSASFTILSNTDGDSDGLCDAWQLQYGVSDPAGDADGDGLLNAQEFAARTRPDMWDTDGDGPSDSVELGTLGTHPLLVDSDGDGVDIDSDDVVDIYNDGNDPYPANPDHDGDYMADGWEQRYGLDNNYDDALEDFDDDNWPNVAEFWLGTSPYDNASHP